MHTPYLLIVSLLLFSFVNAVSLQADGHRQKKIQEFYEWRIYHIDSQANQDKVTVFLKDALIPALHRQSIDRIGVFEEIDAKTGEDLEDYAIHMLIPYATFDKFVNLNDKLEADAVYQATGKSFFATPKKKPYYTRIESSFMRAFAGMPVLEKKLTGERIFEVRNYESHQTEKAKLKIEMFNKAGEIDLMKKTELGPVFFGETLIAKDVPQMTYMLSAKNLEAHREHWKTFFKHPEWKKMTKIERYKGSVSNIKKWFFKPLPFSEI